TESDSFANGAVSSTGAGIPPGDLQVFCINDNLAEAEELANDPRGIVNLAGAYYGLSQVYLAEANLAQAEQALSTAVTIDPQFTEAQKKLSSVREKLKSNK